ncbi:MAG: hypothetical protein ACK5MZ_05130 [Aestuariibaculum sp.]
MVLDDIEKLLEKYENGETNLNEEQRLKTYFAQETVPPHLAVYKSIFTYFLENQNEQFTKNIPLKHRKTLNYKWIYVAAVAVIMAGFYFKTPISSMYSKYAYGTYHEPEQALDELTKSLAMISSQFNKGVSSVSYLNKYKKGAESLSYLGELEKSTQIIFKPISELKQNEHTNFK